MRRLDVLLLSSDRALPRRLRRIWPWGPRVRRAATCEEALLAAARHRPDILVADLDRGGEDLLRFVRRQDHLARLGAVALARGDEEEAIERAAAVRAMAWTRPPADAATARQVEGLMHDVADAFGHR